MIRGDKLAYKRLKVSISEVPQTLAVSARADSRWSWLELKGRTACFGFNTDSSTCVWLQSPYRTPETIAITQQTMKLRYAVFQRNRQFVLEDRMIHVHSGNKEFRN